MKAPAWAGRGALGKERRFLFLAGLLWAGSVAYGMKVLMDYRSAPGPLARASKTWPSGSALRRADSGDTLVMLAHPHCPCTRASIEELNLIMNRFRGRLSASVVFVRPAEFPEGWEKTDSWRRAGEIPGVAVLADVDGVEARRFGGYTSGQVLLYDAAGALAYNGGITDGRGHQGDNEGLRDVVALVQGEKRGPISRNVFGCLLFSEQAPAASKGGPS